MKRLVAALVLCSLALAAAPVAAAKLPPPEHIVVFTMPGTTWGDILAAHTPALDSMIARGAVADMSVRRAVGRTTPERGFLALGAGNRAYAPKADPQAQLAFPADAPFENGTAAQALSRRFGRPPRGDIVHLGLAWLVRQSRAVTEGTRLGALGQALADAHVPRAVVSAGDLSPTPRPTLTMRRAAVLALVDRRGTVDSGTLTGLVRPAPGAAFGVETDPDAFAAAARDALRRARVVLLDPGETVRAEEFSLYATPEEAALLKRTALERADHILARVLQMTSPRDRVYVVAPSAPQATPVEHLTPLVAAGNGIRRGWLSSETTQRPGLATLSDLAPTILDSLELKVPAWMTGTTIRSRPSLASGRVAQLARLDRESVFRERFASVVVGVFIALLSILAVLAFVVFLAPSPPVGRVLAVVAYTILAVPPAGLLARALDVNRLGLGAGHAVFWGFVAALAAAAYLVPGPRWTGGVLLLVGSALMLSADLMTGARLQLNALFGNSPIVAGRFYGIGNLGFAILFSSTILGLTGALDLSGRRRAPGWIAAPLAVLVLVDGLPVFGADFGGVLAGVPAVAATYALARGRRIRWRSVLVVLAGAVVLAFAMTAIDLARPPTSRTHLGRFAASLLSGGLPALWQVIVRKAQANISLLGVSQWTYSIPVTLAVLLLLLWRPRGIIRELIPNHPVLRAGLTGTLVAGVVGFAVNDSGIAIPAMVLAHVVPFFVLMGVETVAPRKAAPEPGG